MSDILSILLEFPPDNVAQLSVGAYDKKIRSYLSNIREITPKQLATLGNGQDLLDVG